MAGSLRFVLLSNGAAELSMADTGPWNDQGESYFSVVDEHVLLGAVPLAIFGHVNKLRAMGVRGVVNMQREYSGPVASYSRGSVKIEQLHLPTVDHEEPRVEDLQRAVEFIRKHASSGGRVLVHCKGGHGRSAAVAAAWLMTSEGGNHTPRMAQEKLNAVRHVRKKLFKQDNIKTFYSRYCSSASQ